MLQNKKNMNKQKEYVGELIRKEIKQKRLTNGYVIQGLKEKGIDMSDTKFSNKIYGVRDLFNEAEAAAISEILSIKL